jgi:hypothetical protein
MMDRPGITFADPWGIDFDDPWSMRGQQAWRSTIMAGLVQLTAVLSDPIRDDLVMI